jgi:hypothetical protein
VLLSPGHGCRGRFLQIGRSLPKALAESPIVDHEGLVPLIQHLIDFPHEGHEDRKRLQEPTRDLGNGDLVALLRRQPCSKFAKRSRWGTRRHPWPAVGIVVRAAERR